MRKSENINSKLEKITIFLSGILKFSQVKKSIKKLQKAFRSVRIVSKFRNLLNRKKLAQKLHIKRYGG